MGKQKREQSLAPKRSRDELARYFMKLRLQEAELKAQEYERTLGHQEELPA